MHKVLGCRAPVTSLTHDGNTDPWQAIAKALGVQSHDLLFWEKLGRTVHIPRLPGFKAADKPQPLLVCDTSGFSTRHVFWHTLCLPSGFCGKQW